MCIIIDNRNGKKIPSWLLERCTDENPDGFGLVDLSNGNITRTTDMDEAVSLMEKTKWFVAHCRWATHGSVTLDNCHPYINGDLVVFMNGTLSIPTRGDKSDTLQLVETLDHVSAEALPKLLGLFDSRFLVFNQKTGKLFRTGKWVKENGVWYSKTPPRKSRVVWTSKTYNNWSRKSNWKPAPQNSFGAGFGYYDDGCNDGCDSIESVTETVHDQADETAEYNRGYRAGYDDGFADCEMDFETMEELESEIETETETETTTEPDGTELIAVYGTLKIGQANHSAYLSQAAFMGEAKTTKLMRLVDNGWLPYLIRGEDISGCQVAVEVFKVTQEQLADIDQLEGHPGYYRRERIPVTMNETGEIVFAWCWMVSKDYDNGLTPIENWDGRQLPF